MKVRFLILAVLVMALACIAYAQTTTTATLTAKEAIDHVGKKSTVCGKVVSTKFANTSRGQPTFLNLDVPYPNQVFTVVIWGRNRSTFGKPERHFQDKKICVTGVIETYRGKAQIEARNPKQITLAQD